MLAHQVLEEVVTLPEASVLAQKMEYPLDRSNLLRYARAGRLVARKSQGTWLTTRAALQALIVELAAESRGRPRAATPDWAKVEITPDLTATLTEIEKLREQIASQPSTAAKQARSRRELTVEAIYYTNHIEGNPLTLPEVRMIVEAFWAEPKSQILHEGQAVYEPTMA